MAVKGVFTINGHDYAPYVKAKTGLGWSRDNTNDEDAGRDAGNVMHPNVTSHQRKLTLKLGPMPFEIAQQLETDLQNGDEGVRVQYPDLMDGICTRLFYNTSINLFFLFLFCFFTKKVFILPFFSCVCVCICLI